VLFCPLLGWNIKREKALKIKTNPPNVSAVTIKKQALKDKRKTLQTNSRSPKSTWSAAHIEQWTHITDIDMTGRGDGREISRPYRGDYRKLWSALRAAWYRRRSRILYALRLMQKSLRLDCLCGLAPLECILGDDGTGLDRFGACVVHLGLKRQKMTMAAVKKWEAFGLVVMLCTSLAYVSCRLANMVFILVSKGVKGSHGCILSI